MEQTQCHSAGLALNYKTDNLLLPFIISLCILRDAIVVGVETYCVSLQYSGLKNRPGVEKAWVWLASLLLSRLSMWAICDSNIQFLYLQSDLCRLNEMEPENLKKFMKKNEIKG